MPRSNVLEEEKIDETKKEKKAKEKTEDNKKNYMTQAQLMSQDDDLFDLVLAKDPRLASIYLVAEKAAERAVMQLMLMFGQMNKGKDEDELDKAIKMYILEKLKKEEEEKEELKKSVLPLLMKAVMESMNEKKRAECVRQRLVALALSGVAITPNVIAKVQQECAQGVSMDIPIGMLTSMVASGSQNTTTNNNAGGDIVGF